MKEKIISRWITEKGWWNENTLKFMDRTFKEEFKIIEMKIKEDSNKRGIISFIGGPTGHESYCIEDLVSDISLEKITSKDELCICAGTINRWSACYVNMSKVFDFIEKHR